jgi:hypothetical protein
LFSCLSEPRHRHESEGSSSERGAATPSTPRTRKSAYKRNPVWEHFTEEENPTEDFPRGVCRECGQSIKRSGASPSQMKSHLRMKHPHLHEQYEARLKEFKRQQVNLTFTQNYIKHWSYLFLG